MKVENDQVIFDDIAEKEFLEKAIGERLDGASAERLQELINKRVEERTRTDKTASEALVTAVLRQFGERLHAARGNK